ncbi:MAG: 1,4-alpha-glucan branching protein GlgB [Nitrospinota bacterium]|nr:1,4-alpha-glucan branching protein GlgB [Nitrospinota bacterium]
MDYYTSRPEVDRIVNADHHDPYSVLGIHPVKRGVVVRAFSPESAEIAVVDIHNRDLRYPMEKTDEAGFFEVFIPKRDIFAYDLHKVNFQGQSDIRRDPYSFLPTLGEMDLYLFNEGSHYEIHKKLGAHQAVIDNVAGVRFAVWAPNARRVSVVGDFCRWDGRTYPMRVLGASGVWEIFIPGLAPGALYKYELRARNGDVFDKADPFAYASELRPRTSSMVWDIAAYQWNDDEWIARRKARDLLATPMNVYELHLGSWARDADGNWLTYRQLAPLLAEYARQQNYTHIELMPVMEYPLDESWGYQVTGFFSPTSRFGNPDDLKYFIDFLHNQGIGVLVDWVPAHFPKDAFGLRMFDGTALYEHEDWRMAEHKDWGTLVFNYGRREVSNFLLSSLLYWLEYYHMDGVRVDAVASMLYLDYSRKAGEWAPNKFGGNENLDAMEFLKKMNALVHERFPGVVTIAEESTAWPGVSKPVYMGGLGFTMKWNMGWMHDILEYFTRDPIYRKYHHSNLTFAMLYAFHENFVLSLSHDEVVHGKKSLIDKMPGDLWQKFANMRLLFAYMFAHPGKKMVFMGAEIGQWREWDHGSSLDWGLLAKAPHARLQRYVADLGAMYLAEPSLWEDDFSNSGFEWIDFHDTQSSIISFMRKGRDPADYTIYIFNFTPEPRYGYRIGAPESCYYKEILNSDAEAYYGSNMGNHGGVSAEAAPYGNWPCTMTITLPPLAALAFKPVRG